MIRVERVEPEDWLPMLATAHLVVFGEHITPSDERLDFALVATDEENILSYVNCREFGQKALYWGWGGSFPSAQGTLKSWQIYGLFTEKCWELGYTRIFTFIRNTNAVMLKFAAKMGYIITGCRTIDGETYLDHMLERPHGI